MIVTKGPLIAFFKVLSVSLLIAFGFETERVFGTGYSKFIKGNLSSKYIKALKLSKKIENNKFIPP